jgi:hypothetical protein
MDGKRSSTQWSLSQAFLEDQDQLKKLHSQEIQEKRQSLLRILGHRQIKSIGDQSCPSKERRSICQHQNHKEHHVALPLSIGLENDE